MSNHHKNNQDNKNKKSQKKTLCIDDLFPSDNKSGVTGKKLDIETLFSNTPLNNDPSITFSSDILIERRKKRRKEKLNHYRQILKYCHKRIEEADENQDTDIFFTVVDTITECKDYCPLECLNYISVKLREEDFDTIMLSDTTIFITWKYIELKKEINKQEIMDNKINKLNNNNINIKTNTNTNTDINRIYNI